MLVHVFQNFTDSNLTSVFKLSVKANTNTNKHIEQNQWIDN